MKKTFSSIISSLHSGSCKSKDEISSSALPPIFCLSPANPKAVEIDFPLPTSARWMAGPAVVRSTAGCRCLKAAAPAGNGRRPRRRLAPAIDTGEDDMSRARETPAYLWRKEEKWHVVACSEEVERMKIDEDEDADEEEEEEELSYPRAPLITHFTESRRRRQRDIVQRRRRSREHKNYRSRSMISASSHESSFSSSEDEENDEREDEDDNEDEDEHCYVEDGDETSTLLSSLSFGAADSSRNVLSREQYTSTEPRTATASAVGMLRKLVPCAEEGKVQESFAVVKKSEDPTGDFRRSMAEMVVEKGIYDAADLEQLLHCFLSLNSRHHHLAIVSAFTDIWQTLFPENSPHFSYKQ